MAPALRYRCSATIARRRHALLTAQGLRNQFGGFAAREVLLAGDQIAISNGEAAPEAALGEDAAQSLDPILDAPGHNVLTARERARRAGLLVALSSSMLVKPVMVCRACGQRKLL